MSFDRKLFKAHFSKGLLPDWPCPVCGKGVLEGLKGSFERVETSESAAAHTIRDWEPEWISYIYTSQFSCSSARCKAIVFNVGTGGVESYVDYSNEQGYAQEYSDYFQPTFFLPHLKIFNVPKETPEDITSSVFNSFELFFSNPSASANQIRIALEQLLDSLKVKKYALSKGKRHIIPLHGRIGLIPKKFSDFQDAMYAIKWLGNDGSHPKQITLDDVMDVYEILEYLLEEIFGKKSEKTKNLVKKINESRK